MSRTVRIGRQVIGGGAPVAIQSMTNTDTRDVDATVQQILALEQAGCQIVRLSVYDTACAQAISAIKKRVHIPLVADIHFDHRLALRSIEAGVDKLRINPGNIGSQAKVQEVASAAQANGIPIRIGVNGGSLEKELLARYGGPTPQAMVESALKHVAMLETCHFTDMVISVKHSTVKQTVEAYRLLAQKVDYPLHLGVTETGTVRLGIVKSAMGIGALLLDGIGDTLRVSLAGDPVREVTAAKDILRAAGLYNQGVEIIACPTCGRTTVDVEQIALELERRVAHIQTPLKAAVMGCVVNGPGEAREADVGIAGAAGDAILFRKGEKVARLRGQDALNALVEELELLDKQARYGE